jgi:hypothetical protein
MKGDSIHPRYDGTAIGDDKSKFVRRTVISDIVSCLLHRIGVPISIIRHCWGTSRGQSMEWMTSLVKFPILSRLQRRWRLHRQNLATAPSRPVALLEADQAPPLVVQSAGGPVGAFCDA